MKIIIVHMYLIHSFILFLFLINEEFMKILLKLDF